MVRASAAAGAGDRKVLFRYDYRRSPDQDSGTAVRHPVVVVGAGPVGLAAAVDLALSGVAVVLLDDSDRIGEGSRGICYAKRTLEILDRLGIGEALVARGVTWKLGKVFLGDALVYGFDLLPEGGHKMPAFINLQQYYLEKALVDRALGLKAIDLRWMNRVVGLERRADHVRLTVATPDGPYAIEADWVVAADGAKSTMPRADGARLRGSDLRGQVSHRRRAHGGGFPHRAAVLVRSAVPFRPVGPHAPPARQCVAHRPAARPRRRCRGGAEARAGGAAAQEDAGRSRVCARMGLALPLQLPAACALRPRPRRLRRRCRPPSLAVRRARRQFRHPGRREPRLEACRRARRPGRRRADRVSYDVERVQAADENIGHSTRSTDFIAPRSDAERRLRNAVLHLAPQAEFARRMVNSGRLSTASVYDSPLSTPDEAPFAGPARLGAPVPDAPVTTRDGRPGFLLEGLGGRFEVLYVADGARPNLPEGIGLTVIGEDIFDTSGACAARLDASPGATYVLRPDQHLAARFRGFDGAKVIGAVERAMGRG